MNLKILALITFTTLLAGCSSEDNQTEAASSSTVNKAPQKEMVSDSTNAVSNEDKMTLAWKVDGFSNPECVIYDEKRNVLYVSNLDGSPFEKDGKGTISVVSMDGEVLEAAWIVGLNSPKGLTIYNDKLYVADIDTLVEIDIESRLISNSYLATGTTFLNDVAVSDSGEIFVTETNLNRIYRLHDKQFDIWLESSELEMPNGIYAEQQRLIIGAWGNMTDGFATEIPGHLKEVNLDSKKMNSLGSGTPVGNIDGLKSDGNGNYYVTDWMAGKLFLVTPTGEATQLLEIEQGTADIEVLLDKKMIFIPLMKSNQLVAYKIN